MSATCDHLLWGSRDLEHAIAALSEWTGVEARPAGHHPDLGTHNATVAIGRKRFIEIIAPDPSLRPGAVARRLAAYDTPRLIMWAARTRCAADVAACAQAEGYTATTVEGRRARPDGSVARWTNVFVAGHGGGTLVPFFIEWHDGRHPADEAPGGLHLRNFHAETPEPEALRAVLAALDVRLPVRRGAISRLVAVLDSPRGPVQLVGP